MLKAERLPGSSFQRLSNLHLLRPHLLARRRRAMRDANVIVVAIVITQTIAHELAATYSAKVQDFTDSMVEKLINEIEIRARSDMGRTALAKPAVAQYGFLHMPSAGMQPHKFSRSRFAIIASAKKSKVKKAPQGFGAAPKGFGSSTKKESVVKLSTPVATKVDDTFPYSGDLRPGQLSPTREVPHDIVRPDYAFDGIPKNKGPFLFPGQAEVKSEKDIEGMRAAGRIAREVLDAAGRAVAVGVTTDSIDAVVHSETVKRGAYPSPLNYHKFPKSCCTSVNEVICHGIPDSYKLRDGDIVNIDVTVFYKGYHGDLSEMFLVGNVDEKGKELVKVTHDAWQEAIKYCKPGQPWSGIGAVIEDYVEKRGYSSCPHFVGHHIGKVFHLEPYIRHVRNNDLGKMQVGQTFTIEPMICEGTTDHLLWKDEWTETTRDGTRSAQFEHTLLVTPTGVEPLTARLPSSNKFWWEKE